MFIQDDKFNTLDCIKMFLYSNNNRTKIKQCETENLMLALFNEGAYLTCICNLLYLNIPKFISVRL